MLQNVIKSSIIISMKKFGEATRYSGKEKGGKKMVRKNKNTELKFSAKIISRGKDGQKRQEKAYCTKKEIKQFEADLPNIQCKEDSILVLEYLINGRKIELLEEGKIRLFPPIPYGTSIEYLWEIENPRLFALLEQLVRS